MKKTWLDAWKDKLYIERQALDSLLLTIKSNIIALAVLVGMFAMPALPAFFAYASVKANAIVGLTANEQVWASWIAAVVLEAAGIYASWVMIRTYQGWRDRVVSGLEAIAMLVPVALYVFPVLYLVSRSELNDTMRALGYVSPFIGVSFYVTLGWEFILNTRQDERRIERERKRAEKAQSYAVATTHLAVSAVSAPQAAPQKTYSCESCGAEFARQQSFAAHKRHCKGEK